jgi:hypothetical protein
MRNSHKNVKNVSGLLYVGRGVSHMRIQQIFLVVRVLSRSPNSHGFKAITKLTASAKKSHYYPNPEQHCAALKIY